MQAHKKISLLHGNNFKSVLNGYHFLTFILEKYLYFLVFFFKLSKSRFNFVLNDWLQINYCGANRNYICFYTNLQWKSFWKHPNLWLQWTAARVTHHSFFCLRLLTLLLHMMCVVIISVFSFSFFCAVFSSLVHVQCVTLYSRYIRFTFSMNNIVALISNQPANLWSDILNDSPRHQKKNPLNNDITPKPIHTLLKTFNWVRFAVWIQWKLNRIEYDFTLSGGKLIKNAWIHWNNAKI